MACLIKSTATQKIQWNLAQFHWQRINNVCPVTTLQALAPLTEQANVSVNIFLFNYAHTHSNIHSAIIFCNEWFEHLFYRKRHTINSIKDSHANIGSPSTTDIHRNLYIIIHLFHLCCTCIFFTSSSSLQSILKICIFWYDDIFGGRGWLLSAKNGMRHAFFTTQFSSDFIRWSVYIALCLSHIDSFVFSAGTHLLCAFWKFNAC